MDSENDMVATALRQKAPTAQRGKTVDVSRKLRRARSVAEDTGPVPPWQQGVETLKRREQMKMKALREAADTDADHPALQIYKEPIALRVTITPGVAHIFLEKREGKNRPLRPQLVDDYSMAMREGKWSLNGETIKIDINGRLIDGQHRLSMVIETGKSLDTFMIAGLHPDAFDTIDLGAKRTIAQALQIKGYTYTTNLAAAARILWRYERGTLPYKGVKPDAGTIYQVVKKHPRLLDAVKRAFGAQSVIRVNVHAAMFYVFSGIDQQTADEYARQMQYGLFSAAQMRHPWRLLREKLSKEGKRSHSKDRVDDTISDVMNAWNMVRRGEKGEKLKIEERFPDLV